MKFTCNLKSLSEAVNNVSLAVSSRTNLQALEGILLDCTGGTLTLTGYNLELGIIKSIEVAQAQDGRIILNAKIYGDILRKMPSDEISIDTDHKFLTIIRGGDAEFTILGTSAEEYPDVPTISDEDGFPMQQNVLRNMISQTLFAVSQNENTPVHTGSLFDLSNGILNVVSVDGYRLALRTEPVKVDQDFHFVVPGRTLNEVIKLLSEEDDKECYIKVSRKHIIFEISGYQIISRLLEGEFLDYRSAIGGESKTKIRISTRAFSASLDRASIIITDRIKRPITARIEEGHITISCMTSLGKVIDTIPAEIEGDDLTIGFNNKYMTDALKATGTDEVMIQANGPFAPMRIVPLSGDHFTFLVLPVRLKTE